MAITPSVTMINRLKRMAPIDITPVLDEGSLSDALVMYAMADYLGVAPGEYNWVETYDLNGAAMTMWEWKEAKASNMISINADGSQWSLAQITANCQAKVNYYRALRQTGNISVVMTP